MSDARPVRTEPEGVPARPVLWVAGGFFAFVGLCLAGVYFYYSDVVGNRTQPKPETFPAPQLQRTPLSDLEALQKSQREQLKGYAWVDKGQGIVHVPIGRAMQIVASKGAGALSGTLDDLIRPPAQNTDKKQSAKATQNSPAQQGVH